MAYKKKSGEGISALIRDAGSRAKLAQKQSEQKYLDQRVEELISEDFAEDKIHPFRPKIFNILEYIEQSWGLGMTLFPAQKFIVKLYYHLPLDDQEKTISIPDMFATKVLYRFTEKEYLKYLYDEGRCNIGEQDHARRELVLALGRRSGKCVTSDSLVLTGKGIYRIEDLATAPEEDSVPFITLVAQEKDTRSLSTAFYNGGVKPTYRIKSKSGYVISGTGNHRIKVLTSEGIIDWRYLDEIRSGDFLAINRCTDLWASEKLDLSPYHNTDGYKEVELPSVLDERLGGILGYLVGDGTWNEGHATSLTIEHPETWERLRILMDSLFGKCQTLMDKRTDNTGRLQFCSVRVRRFLDAIGWKLGTRRDKKMIPWSILRSPKSVICAFLRGLFETDGCAEKDGGAVTFSSASFRLAHEVQILLLNLGIISSVKRKWVPKTKRYYAILGIKGYESRKRFVELIGFESDKKRIPVENHFREKAQDGKSDTDSVPFQFRHLRNLIESTPRHNAAGGKPGWSRSKLRKAIGNSCKPNSGEDITYSRIRETIKVAKELGADQTEIAHFENLLSLNYFFDEAVSIEEEEDQVYDLVVPNGEIFVANGFTNHNTSLSGIFASYEVYRLLNLQNPQAYYGLPNGNRIQITSIATDKDQAGLLFNEVSSHLAKCKYFDPFVANNTQTNTTFQTPYDIEHYGIVSKRKNGKYTSFMGKATLRVTFKSCIAKGLRGAGNIVVIMDEMAHYQDQGQSSAKDIYDAVTPSTAAFSPKGTDGKPMKNSRGEPYPVESRIISISSPLNRGGKFYDLFHLAMSRGLGSENILAIQAPTWEVNPTIPSSYYRQKYHEDSSVFMTEHGALFSDRVRGWIEREVDLLECVDPNLKPQMMGVPRYPHQAGIDIGLMGDGTAVAITYNLGGKVILAYHEYWQAGIDWRVSNPHLGNNYSTDYCKSIANVERLDFDEIANWIFLLTKKFYITEGLFDRWNGIPLEQSLLKKGLTQFKAEFFQRELSSRIYQNTKMMMFDKSLRLYDYPIGQGAKHSAFITELLELQAQQMSRNIVLVEAPKVAGHHDDRSDAYVRSVWLTSERMRNEKYVYGPGVINSNMYPGTTMTAGRYQSIRARKHGGFSDRTIPRNLGLRFRGLR